MEELSIWIQYELPLDGEWWNDGDEDFIHCANEMLNAGMSINIIKEILQKLYNAVANEYG